MLAAFQAQLLFPTHAVAPPGPLPRGAVPVELATTDGATLRGIHIAPAAPAPDPRTLILGFGGNAWNGADVAAMLHQLYPHADVVAFHYRGYRPSTGVPSAAALLADAPHVHDLAVNRVKPERVIAAGFSIGSAIAASLAGRRPIDGLILVTPFDSLKAAASGLFPFLPVNTLFAHELDTVSYLSGDRVPVALIAAAEDEVIRPARTAALRRNVANIVLDRTIAGAGHNDLYARGDFAEWMRAALAAMPG